MSIDTHILLRTPLSASQVRAALVHDAALADLHLVDNPTYMHVAGPDVGAIVRPWQEDDGHLIENGFATGTVRCKLIPGRGPAGWDAMYRVIAAILRLVPGDVCLADQNAAGPDLLRLGEVVYINTYGLTVEEATSYGYTPKRLVIGIPEERQW